MVDELYVTHVDTEIDVSGYDKSELAYFKFDPELWKKVWSEKHSADDKHKYDFEFVRYERLAYLSGF